MIRLLVLLLAGLLAVLQGCATTGPSAVTVMVTGLGATPELARRSAFRDAIQMAYGSLHLSERRVTNDSLFEDDVSYARGVIESFRVLSQRVDPKDGQHRVEMSVTVSPTAMERRILASQDSNHVDGREIGRQMDIGRQQALSEVDRYLAARRLFEHVTRDIGTGLFEVKAGELRTIRNGANIGLVVDVTVTPSETSLQTLCRAAKAYQGARTSSVPAKYRDGLSRLAIRHAYDCSVEADVEPVHMAPMRASLSELGLCLAVSDAGGQLLNRSFYQTNPKLVEEQLRYNGQFLAPGAYLVADHRHAGAVVLVRNAWGNARTFRLELPPMPDSVVRRIDKVTAVLASDEGCTGPKAASPLGFKLAGSAGAVTVSSLVPNSSAQRAGLQIGDRLLAVDGATLAGLAPQAVVERLSGRPGGWIAVEVVRKSDGQRAMLRLAVR